MPKPKAPRKRMFKKRHVKPRRTKKSSELSINQNLIKYYSKLPQQVLPASFKSKFTAETYGYMALGAGSGDLRFAFPMNSPRVPFAQAVSAGAGTWTYNNITAATQTCAGYATLLNANCYRTYRVMASSITASIQVQSVADAVEMVITPSNANNVPATIAAALPQRLSKSLSIGQSQNRHSLTYYMPIHKFVGVRRQAILDDLTTNFTAAYTTDPARQYYWIVNIETGDNQPLNQALLISFKLTYYVECFDQTNSTLPVV